MAVPAYRRDPNGKYNFYIDVRNTCNEIIKYLLRDFGIKGPIRDLKTFSNRAKMEDFDTKLFSQICKKYNIDVEADYPYWCIEHFRNRILDTIDKVLYNLTAAYSVNPNSATEISIKTKYQHDLIANLEYLIQLMDQVIRLFNYKNIDIEKYSIHIKRLEKCLKEVRTWKRNSIRSTRDIEAREFATKLESAEKGYNFVSTIVDEKLIASGIDPKDPNISTQELVDKCLENKKNIDKKRKEIYEEKAKKRIDKFNKKYNKQEVEDLNDIVDTQLTFSELIKTKDNLVQMKDHNIYFDYNDMVQVAPNIKIPKCIYDENFETKIIIKSNNK